MLFVYPWWGFTGSIPVVDTRAPFYLYVCTVLTHDAWCCWVQRNNRIAAFCCCGIVVASWYGPVLVNAGELLKQPFERAGFSVVGGFATGSGSLFHDGGFASSHSAHLQ